MQAPTFPLIAVGSGLTTRFLTSEGFVCPSLLFVIQVMGCHGSLLRFAHRGKSHHSLTT
jgi:hypothetical protein